MCFLVTVDQRLKLSLEDLGYGLLAGRNLPFVVKTRVMLSAVRGILREEGRRNCLGGAPGGLDCGCIWRFMRVDVVGGLSRMIGLSG